MTCKDEIQCIDSSDEESNIGDGAIDNSRVSVLQYKFRMKACSSFSEDGRKIASIPIIQAVHALNNNMNV
jgi:hypothetical protein